MNLSEVVISDASCLINLERIGSLELLKEVFGKVVTTRQVAEEFRKPLPEWCEIREAPEGEVRKIQKTGLHPGESSAIALAEKYWNSLLIIDETEARLEASKRGLKIIGTLGFLLRAKKKGRIGNIKPLIEQLKNVGFRMSESLIRQVLHQAGEL